MKTRTDARPGRPGARWWLGAGIVAAGAVAAAYLLDPKAGQGRRDRIAGRTGHAMRQVRRNVTRELRYARTTVGGRMRHVIEGDAATFADGRTLLDRVESELFEDPSIPHGRINLEVETTTVVLRGQLDSWDEIARIEEAVLGIPGVGAVRNLLHVPGMPAPNKVAALKASAKAAGRADASGGWPREAPPDVDSES
ncbi:MAG TPA: BON domain-containing protein [Candidatus Sulfotelmatobacter sp.]|nr:BON domain-containing protein [Candidatus Sulfotelmatobacter sp.]